jgi:hypothetical protein
MIKSLTRGRLLLGLAIILAVVLVAGTDGFVIKHFGAHAATGKGTDSYLSSIACPSASQCWAVGQTASAPGGNTYSEVRSQLIEQETAGAWRKVTAPAIAEPQLALTGITCPGSRDCWAVGGSGSSGPAIIEHWTGGTWQLVSSPQLTGGQLVSVSCASASLCWASGGQQTRKNRTSDVLEQWNGTSWQMVSGLAGGLRPTLFSCPVAGHCLILGVRTDAPAAVSYDLGQWSPAALPVAVQGNQLPDSLACTGPASCLALMPAREGAVTEVWNGRSWSISTATVPRYPAGLACSAAHGCWLLGTSDEQRPLALRWQGGSWMQVPVTHAARPGYLSSLDCGSSCWAIGGKTTTLGDGSSYSEPLAVAVAGT